MEGKDKSKSPAKQYSREAERVVAQEEKLSDLEKTLESVRSALAAQEERLRLVKEESTEESRDEAAIRTMEDDHAYIENRPQELTERKKRLEERITRLRRMDEMGEKILKNFDYDQEKPN